MADNSVRQLAAEVEQLRGRLRLLEAERHFSSRRTRCSMLHNGDSTGVVASKEEAGSGTHYKDDSLPSMQHRRGIVASKEEAGSGTHYKDDSVPSDVPMSATRVVMHQVVLPADVDTLGICFGGKVLSWIDVCAGLSARTLARGPCVTASVDDVHFIRPCRISMIVIVAAMVHRTFRSSMEVGVRVEAEDTRSGARYHCCSAYLTFVRQARDKAKLPTIQASTSDQWEQYRGAERRRHVRLEQKATVEASRHEGKEVLDTRLKPITHRDHGPTLPRALLLEPGEGGTLPRRVGPTITTCSTTEAVMPHHANTMGITFGGQVMQWMELCAYISASRLRCPHTLTASMDSLSFVKATHVGHIVYLTSQVNAVFKTSMEAQVTVYGEDPASGTLFHCADAFITLVSVTDKGAPTTIPLQIEPQNPEEQLRYDAALQRRDRRLSIRKLMQLDDRRRPSLDVSGAANRTGASSQHPPIVR